MSKGSTSQRNSRAIVVVRGEDWEGLYINGQLAVEGHMLSPVDVFTAFGIRVDVINCNEEWLAEERSLPINLADVKF